ncbi:MAG: 4Fe-4S binding protein [Anaerolineae bacterium]|nr:4Fe-4S binding protein [Anaerolineae bacterium]MBL6964990.1 4Fe-4S binding protein [Anaerolineales bacterium]
MSVGTARTILLKVDDDLCHACRKCLAGEACRGSAFRRFDREDAPFIDTSRCWGCLDCIAECPFDAVVRHEHK